MLINYNRMIRIWDMKTKLNSKILEDHMGGIECIQYDHAAKRIISGARDCNIKVCSFSLSFVPSTSYIRIFNLSSLMPALFAISIHTHMFSFRIQLWDVETEDVVATLEEHNGWVTCLQCSDSTLVSGYSLSLTFLLYSFISFLLIFLF